LAEPGASDGGLNARGDYERQGAFIMDLYRGVANPECLKHFLSLPVDRLAIVRLNPRLKFNLNAAAIARLDAHVDVGADLSAPMSNFRNG
jgi:hypothetical protein